jgi:hypothetical protein
VATGNPVVDLRTALDEIRPLVADVVAVDVTTPDVDEVGFRTRARRFVALRGATGHQHRAVMGFRYDLQVDLRVVAQHD